MNSERSAGGAETVRYTPRRLLVTGGAGFIGANFVEYWLARHQECRVIVLDALTYAGNPANLRAIESDHRFTFIQGDIADADRAEGVLREHDIDTIVHFAAESHVDRSIHGPDAFLHSNIIGTHGLLKAARRVWLEGSGPLSAAHRFHHVSTDEVYGSLEPAEAPFREENRYAPNSVYSASKAGSDHLVRAYHQTYGLQVVTSNCSNNYGPFQFPEKLIPLVVLNILHGRPIPVYGDGQNVRDWLYVKDHCVGIEMCIMRGRVGETYNLGGRNEWANIDIVRFLCNQLDERFAADSRLAMRFPDSPRSRGLPASSLITFVADRAGHDRRYAIDTSKAERELGYGPAETFESGMSKTVQWYLDNEGWWKDVMDGSYREWIRINYAV